PAKAKSKKAKVGDEEEDDAQDDEEYTEVEIDDDEEYTEIEFVDEKPPKKTLTKKGVSSKKRKTGIRKRK
ncbi:MAG TPA: hypothetical protein PKD85_01745, partial [Saprospiraceae bacterium]|nr:hypothetical protein [Saprospiraceae bacterium]